MPKPIRRAPRPRAASKKHPAPSPQTEQRLRAARLAEAWVAEALARQGWRIVVRNYRKHGFELDLVAMKAETISVVEVKAVRRPPRHGRDLESLLSYRKRLALQRGASHLLADLGLARAQLRFDLAIVVGSGVKGPPKAVFYHVNVLG